MTVAQTLAELVAIDSVSRRSNAAIVSYLSRRCEAQGLTLQTFPHLDPDGQQKINLVARTSVDGPVELALIGHTDTVPYDPNWAEALKLTSRNGNYYGRGACDTKAFIAAALTAVDEIEPGRISKPLALIFTADEEIGCLGAARLAAAKPFAVKYAIVGEPTSLQPMRAGKGYCLARITVHGSEAHSAYPQLGASAIFRAARIIRRIEMIAADLQKHRHADFDPPYTTLNVGLISGGTAKNIVPGECGFTLEWRTIPGQNASEVLARVEEAVTALRREDSDLTCQIEANRTDDSFETSAGSRLVKFLESAAGKNAGTVAFGTEAPSMISLGAEPVIFGPGDIRVAHRTGEFVPAGELNACVTILKQAIEQFCV